MSKRILFCADASSVHTQRWVREVAARGFDCIVLTRRPALVTGAQDMIAIRPGDSAAGWFAALPEVHRRAKKIAPQWVHGHYVTSYGLWAAVAAQALSGVKSGMQQSVPLVQTAWGSDLLVTPRAPGWRGAAMAELVRWSLQRAALVTADSQDMLAEVRRYAPAVRCEQVLWGADTERFRPATPAPGFEVVSLRAWEPNYNIDTVLRAFAQLRAERPQAQAVLHLLGGGPDEAALKSLAAQLQLGDAVRFLGRVGDASMISMLQRSRVSVSVPRSDATSVSVLESMACGLPVVATDLPANRQWIDADSGLLLPVRDADALARALVRLFDDPKFARAQGHRNRDVAARLASRRSQMDRMAVLYESLRLRAPAPGA